MDNASGEIAASHVSVVHARLKTPRAAAIAGIVFSLLLICSLLLLRLSIPTDPLEAGAWLNTSRERVSLALNVIPFAGIAFMWFLGVLRDRLGSMEDQFFATVFLGSGLMFLGMLFVGASVAGGIILAHIAAAQALFDAGTFAFARAFAYNIMQIYAFKMAGVFMMTTSTLALRTHITARWIALLGYGLAVLLILGISYLDWAPFVFPIWVLLVSINILIDNLWKPQVSHGHHQ